MSRIKSIQKHVIKDYKEKDPQIYRRVLSAQGEPKTHKEAGAFVMSLWACTK